MISTSEGSRNWGRNCTIWRRLVNLFSLWALS